MFHHLTNASIVLAKDSRPVITCVCDKHELVELETALRSMQPSLLLVRIGGEQCLTEKRLHHEWAKSLQFPDYYGKNWDALSDCLGDIYWYPRTNAKACVIIVTDADQLLARNAYDWEIFWQVIASTAQSYERGSIENERPIRAPGHSHFRVVAQCRPQQCHSLRKRLVQAQVDFEELATHR